MSCEAAWNTSACICSNDECKLMFLERLQRYVGIGDNVEGMQACSK